MLSDITGRGLVPSPIRILSLWNCLHVCAFSLQLPVLKLQPIWYPGSRPGQRLFARESAVMAHITELPSRAARLRGPGEILQFPVDDILDERHVLHHGEMGALPDVDLQT